MSNFFVLILAAVELRTVLDLGTRDLGLVTAANLDPVPAIVIRDAVIQDQALEIGTGKGLIASEAEVAKENEAEVAKGSEVAASSDDVNQDPGI